MPYLVLQFVCELLIHTRLFIYCNMSVYLKIYLLKCMKGTIAIHLLYIFTQKVTRNALKSQGLSASSYSLFINGLYLYPSSEAKDSILTTPTLVFANSINPRLDCKWASVAVNQLECEFPHSVPLIQVKANLLTIKAHFPNIVEYWIVLSNIGTIYIKRERKKII